MSTLFISDLHLADDRPAVTRRLVALLRGEARRCAELYILGDLFDAWIGDDDDSALAAEVAAELKAVADGGTRVCLLPGNRDFLIGQRWAAKAGLELIGEPTRIDLHGTATLLLHGDTLCTEDHDYQAFRRQVRDPAWQAAVLARPLAERRALATKLRMDSQQAGGEKSLATMDAQPEAIAEALRTSGARRLIHGHTHRPGTHELEVDGVECERIVLGDWHADHGSLLRCDGNGCRLAELRDPPR